MAPLSPYPALPMMPAGPLRAAIRSSIPEQTSQFTGEPPDLRSLWVPATHAKALSPDHMLVVGMRGSGKSFWWAALQSQAHREQVARLTQQRSDLLEIAWVDAGFGAVPNPNAYPSADTIADLVLRGGAEPRLIWRMVLIKHVLWQHEHREIGKTWAERLAWVKGNPDEVDRTLYAIDQRLAKEKKKHIVLFDALDRTANDDWGLLRRNLRGLLQVLLEFRSYRSLRAKAFVRPDMLIDPEVTSFPDASKVKTNDVRLDWRPLDLYTLLFQHLANAADDNGAKTFRGACENANYKFAELGGSYILPDELRTSETAQIRIFHALCGPYMRQGKTPLAAKKGGVPYTWLPKHLADASAQISPRSFLAAVRHGLVVEKPSYPYALHYEGLLQGVQKASEIRTEEVEEDFGWIAKTMEPLAGLLVPAEEKQIFKRWDQANTLKTLESGIGLKPRYLAEGGPGLIKEMVELFFCERLADGRINIPDVFRVGFGLGRMGGVKPVR